MRWFLLVMLAMLVLSTFGKLAWLVSGRFPGRTPNGEALDVALNAGLIAWIVWLLAP